MQTSHSPGACSRALAGAVGPVIVVLETTGLDRNDQIVSVGALVDQQPFIIFVGSLHPGITNRPITDLRRALAPLQDPTKTVVFHNATFDLGFLTRAGIPVEAKVFDTMQMLRLLDQDRGGDGADVVTQRHYTTWMPGKPSRTDYRLKHVVPRLCGVRMIDYPDEYGAKYLDYPEHVEYLCSDLFGTRALFDLLLGRLAKRPRLLRYYRRLCVPITPVLVEMTHTGFAADPGMIRSVAAELRGIVAAKDAEHIPEFGRSVVGGKAVAGWLWGHLELARLAKREKVDGSWKPSLKADNLIALKEVCRESRPEACRSLELIVPMRQADSLASKIESLIQHVRADGRIHAFLVDKQATGRISCSTPNLQQVAKPKTIDGVRFVPRDVLVATPGYRLVSVDLAQADVRVMADEVERCKTSRTLMVKHLRSRRRKALSKKDPAFAALYADEVNYRKGVGVSQQSAPERPSDPTAGSRLAEDFRKGDSDFYTVASESMLGRPPAGKSERNFCKQTILGIVNGMGAKALAARLDCTEEIAKGYQAKLAEAYPNDMAFRRLAVERIALTGRVGTFLGRDRTDTGHRFLVTEPRATILVTYKRSDGYWMDVTPIQPHRRVLTCYIHRAWDAKTGKLIFDVSKGGRLVKRSYRLFDQSKVMHFLPYRNFAWRSIRRVIARGEEVEYRGFDAVSRALFNAICQGGTADLAKGMMLNCRPICERFGARLVMQIHDELVFETPSETAHGFAGVIARDLADPPTRKFKVPLVLEPKIGERFGSMVEWRRPRAIAGLRPPRCSLVGRKRDWSFQTPNGV